MPRYDQQFFWAPSEFIEWLQRDVASSGYWFVLREVGKDSRAIRPQDLTTKNLEGLKEFAISLEVGDPDIVLSPIWLNQNDRRIIDTCRSYSVVITPSVIAPDGETLLKGSMAIMRADQYADHNKAEKLVAMFKKLQSSLKNKSTSDFIVVQDLVNGGKKAWRSCLVGKKLPQLKMKAFKQFVDGAVTFRIEPSAQERLS